MKILISGGAGFIGSNLCDFLIKNNHTVVVVDNLSTGSEENLRKVVNEISLYKEDIEYFDFKFFL